MSTMGPVRRRVQTVAAIALVASLAGTTAVSASSPTGNNTQATSLAPPRGLLIGSSNASSSFTSMEQQVGRKFDIHRDYDFWDEAEPSGVVRWDVQNGYVPALSIKPWARSGGRVPWARIASGAEDAAIIRQAKGLQSLGKPVLLALHHEPKDDAAYGTPADYRAAWRHYVQVFRAQGATNVSFAWIMMSWSFRDGGSIASSYYPGDDVIDWLGVDGYNWFTCRHTPWVPFGQVFANFRAWAADHPTKPVIIAEYGSGEDHATPGRKGQWFRDALQTLKGWPQVKALTYFNHSLGAGCEWPIDTSASALSGFRDFVNDPYVTGAAPAGASPTASTASASNVGAAEALLHGSVTPNRSATSYYFEWGRTASYGAKTTAETAGSGSTSTAVVTALRGLAPGTTYHYRVVAQNAYGTSTGADASFTTGAAPAATTTWAQQVTRSTATVGGTVDPKQLRTTWYLQWGSTTAYGSKSASSVIDASDGPLRVSATLSGLTANVYYHYRVVATNSAGTVVGADHFVSVAAAPRAVTAPATQVTSTSATLTGVVDPNSLRTTYRFEWGPTAAYGYSTTIGDAGDRSFGRSFSAAVSHLARYRTYHYRVTAINAVGKVSGSDRTFTTAR